ncbi:tetrahydromethanopterin S-methyltransferase subunit F [Nocardioides aromaticivorans]|uniref:Tetrahydromethanopterin S-methyltransferase subunit F n=1 Tax=Nocardioides aromaticivorans TaxID=200618 RepID=A0A7Z0CPI7_9ACTN|nr:CbtA family protein [Nocardioides aromaticivorans]NYI45842.1 tetrahydromethanopterin S-methyltransferase subunit F [Nocardioides aromaticivorans]
MSGPTPQPRLGRTVGNGALAGAVAGGLGAAAMYWLVEPSIRAAIAIEEAGTAHEHGAGASHDHGTEALVSRSEQVVAGLVTVLVVGVLIGIAFALAHRFLAPRLPGRTPVATTMVLAGLGFLTFTLAPAMVVPANPPAVGDPATVDLRTATYLGTIVCAVALTALVAGVARAGALAPGTRAVAAAALGVVGTVVLVAVLPHAADPVPANVPADLIWRFRVASLAQIGLMWLAMGATCAWLGQPRTVPLARTRRLVAA